MCDTHADLTVFAVFACPTMPRPAVAVSDRAGEGQQRTFRHPSQREASERFVVVMSNISDAQGHHHKSAALVDPKSSKTHEDRPALCSDGSRNSVPNGLLRQAG